MIEGLFHSVGFGEKLTCRNGALESSRDGILISSGCWIASSSDMYVSLSFPVQDI